MNYFAYTADERERFFSTVVSVRSDASIETVYQRIAEALCAELRRGGVNPDSPFEVHMDLPNVWRNGGVGSMWTVADGLLYDFHADRDGRAWL